MSFFYSRDTCRLCGSSKIDLIYKMPPCQPVDNFRFPGDHEISLPKFPMDLYMCFDCGHAQLLDVVDPVVLYGNYIYTSRSSSDLEKHFSGYASTVKNYFQLAQNDKVLDIGSNDGLLLSMFKKLGMTVLGIDPSEYVASRAKENGIRTLVAFFDKNSAHNLLATEGSFNLITANNVFSHADNLREFAESVYSLLSDDGGFVFEVSYLKDLVDNMVIDYVYHEHLCFHSIKPLKRFLSMCHLKLIDVERIATKGGSLRCYAVKESNPLLPEPIIDLMIHEEIDSGLYDLNTYKALKRKIEGITDELFLILSEVVSKGGKVASYGASATSTVLNAMLQINRFLSFIVDDNSLRQGRLSPGYMLPVISSRALEDFRPELVVISAWRFSDEIVAKNQDYLSSGGVFVIPFPQVRLIKK